MDSIGTWRLLVISSCLDVYGDFKVNGKKFWRVYGDCGDFKVKGKKFWRVYGECLLCHLAT